MDSGTRTTPPSGHQLAYGLLVAACGEEKASEVWEDWTPSERAGAADIANEHFRPILEQTAAKLAEWLERADVWPRNAHAHHAARPLVSIREQLGPFLAEQRRRAGLSQAELAGRLGHHQVWLSHIERGRSAPTFDDLERLCQELGVRIEFQATPST